MQRILCHTYWVKFGYLGVSENLLWDNCGTSQGIKAEDIFPRGLRERESEQPLGPWERDLREREREREREVLKRQVLVTSLFFGIKTSPKGTGDIIQ